MKKIFSYTPKRKSSILSDIDDKSDQLLQDFIKQEEPIEELELLKFTTEEEVLECKENNTKKLKKLKTNNKRLKEELKKIRLSSITSDKTLSQLQTEFRECMADCKQIISLLETKFENRHPLKGVNTLTMEDLETELKIEFEWVENESQTLSVQDLTKIKDMLSYIYK